MLLNQAAQVLSPETMTVYATVAGALSIEELFEFWKRQISADRAIGPTVRAVQVVKLLLKAQILERRGDLASRQLRDLINAVLRMSELLTVSQKITMASRRESVPSGTLPSSYNQVCHSDI